MIPMGHDIKDCLRRHQTGETAEDGIVVPVKTDYGPYRVAVRSERAVRVADEQGYTHYEQKAMAIVSDTSDFEPGDRLVYDGKEVWEVTAVTTYPKEQIMELMRL